MTSGHHPGNTHFARSASARVRSRRLNLYLVKTANSASVPAGAKPGQENRSRTGLTRHMRSILATGFLLLAGILMLIAYDRALTVRFFDGQTVSVTLILAVGAVVAFCISLFLAARSSVSPWSDHGR
jgi:hypothetical protein